MSPKKLIEKLTAAQVARFPEFREKWMKLGLSTEPADKPAAEAAVDEAYRAAGLTPPRLKIWLRSPREGAFGAAILARGLPREISNNVRAQVRDQVWAQVRDQVGAQVRDQVAVQVWAQVWAQVRDQVADQVADQVRDQVWDQVRDQVWDQVADQVWDQVWDQVADQVWDQVAVQVWAQVRDQVADQVWDQVADQVWDQVADQVWDQVWDQVYRAGYGQHDASWMAFYDFFRTACGLQSAERLLGLTGVSATSGWFWLFAGAVIFTDRPCHIARDAENRLHCPNRAAIEYRDGWGVYAWHGVRVPKEWILEPGKLDAKTALNWPNIEQRRAAAEILGWAKILDTLGARSIDVDGDPQIGELLEVDLPDSPRQKFLRVRCGTGRTFCLPVAPHLTTALAANAWTFAIEDVAELKSFRNYAVRT